MYGGCECLEVFLWRGSSPEMCNSLGMQENVCVWCVSVPEGTELGAQWAACLLCRDLHATEAVRTVQPELLSRAWSHNRKVFVQHETFRSHSHCGQENLQDVYGGFCKCKPCRGWTLLLALLSLLSTAAGECNLCIGDDTFPHLHLNPKRQQNMKYGRGRAVWLIAPYPLQYQPFIYPLTVFSDSIMLVGFDCR